jgi:hypothetical protein
MYHLEEIQYGHSVRTLNSLSTSDHSPVLLTIRGPLEEGEIRPTFIHRKANWKLYQNYLVNNVNTQSLEGKCSKSEINVAVKHLTDILNRADLYAIPLKRRNFRSMKSATSAHLLIQIKNKPRKQWQRTHDIALRLLINSLKEQIDSVIREHLSNARQNFTRARRQ